MGEPPLTAPLPCQRDATVHQWHVCVIVWLTPVLVGVLTETKMMSAFATSASMSVEKNRFLGMIERQTRGRTRA